MFGRQGWNVCDMTAMSGAHTISFARCATFCGRIYGDTNIDTSYVALWQETRPHSVGDGNLAPIDAQTPAAFDTTYFQNEMVQRGLFYSDQEAVAVTW
jgi:peroxidase